MYGIACMALCVHVISLIGDLKRLLHQHLADVGWIHYDLDMYMYITVYCTSAGKAWLLRAAIIFLAVNSLMADLASFVALPI